ncbi:MAG: ferrous iron transport protein B [Planctomycetes bacterium]|nr:ferrous iron transport protein B [Planctomycetota bacterium]
MAVKTELNLRGRHKIALVGNPNVGKSVIFGLLTGQYVTVSNYPGTTVEVTRGQFLYDKRETVIIDTPGINGLIPNSEDEKVTRDILVNEDINYIVQVADAKNLSRALFLSIQLAETGIPHSLVLNMSDEAKSLGIKINIAKLSQILGVPVIPTIAVQREGIGALIKTIKDTLQANPFVQPGINLVSYEPKVEDAIKELSLLLQSAPPRQYSPKTTLRFQALMLLTDDLAQSEGCEINTIHSVREKAKQSFSQPLSNIINQKRLNKAQEIVAKVQIYEGGRRTSLSDFLGRITMHPFWGIPILLVILFLLYEFVGVLGATTLVGFLENTVFGQYINPFATQLSERFIPIVWLRDFFTGQYGLISMALAYGFAIILPIVATFFLAFGIMEDSGYLPRLAVIVNRLFRLVGLNGKAVLPLVLGLGCDTMATMVTRILPTNKERILTTLLLALGVPCSAQLGVIMGLLSGVSLSAVLWWLGCLLVIMFIVAYFANKVISGVCSDFMMEIPPMRMPEIGNILSKTFARVKWYLKEVIPIFILGTAVLFGLDQTGALAYIEKLFTPVVTGLMGLPKDVTAAFLIGFFRRDYGAAGLYDLAQKGLLNPQQIVVSLITITLFVPCFAQFLMMVKERGWKVALLIIAFIFPLAILVGSAVNLILNLIGGL